MERPSAGGDHLRHHVLGEERHGADQQHPDLAVWDLLEAETPATPYRPVLSPAGERARLRTVRAVAQG